jgi:hypothetical protein
MNCDKILSQNLRSVYNDILDLKSHFEGKIGSSYSSPETKKQALEYIEKLTSDLKVIDYHASGLDPNYEVASEWRPEGEKKLVTVMSAF